MRSALREDGRRTSGRSARPRSALCVHATSRRTDIHHRWARCVCLCVCVCVCVHVCACVCELHVRQSVNPTQFPSSLARPSINIIPQGHRLGNIIVVVVIIISVVNRELRSEAGPPIYSFSYPPFLPPLLLPLPHSEINWTTSLISMAVQRSVLLMMASDALSLSPSLSFSLSPLSLSHPRSLSHPLNLSLSLSLSLSIILSHYLAPSISSSPSLSLPLTLSLPLSLPLSFSHPPSLPQTNVCLYSAPRAALHYGSKESQHRMTRDERGRERDTERQTDRQTDGWMDINVSEREATMTAESPYQE